ncbi:hypothetical protein TIFTF001_041377 [Ficus carica]|uniref:Uncharacterized protein n=1 Tax=Ficus carica TaxID=3494 RepID=A0AA87Z5H6_FICCA|nr:hypothetical protein TIFTF001_041377 [Ficus carica]
MVIPEDPPANPIIIDISSDEEDDIEDMPADPPADSFMADHTNGGEDTSSNHHWILGKEVFPCSLREWLANKATPHHLGGLMSNRTPSKRKDHVVVGFLERKGSKAGFNGSQEKGKIWDSSLRTQIPNPRGSRLLPVEEYEKSSCLDRTIDQEHRMRGVKIRPVNVIVSYRLATRAGLNGVVYGLNWIGLAAPITLCKRLVSWFDLVWTGRLQPLHGYVPRYVHVINLTAVLDVILWRVGAAD